MSELKLPDIDRKINVSITVPTSLHDRMRMLGLEVHGGNTSAAYVDMVLKGLESERRL